VTIFYADSSALVKRYVNEAGSARVQAACHPANDNIIAIAIIGLVEIAAALGMKVRQNLLLSPVRDRLLMDLQKDGRDQYWLIDIDQDLVLEAILLTQRHKLRGYDAAHLASALFLTRALAREGIEAPTLLSSDLELIQAAQAEGLPTEVPA
jgi:predicted nucleic acid-binding protein